MFISLIPLCILVLIVVQISRDALTQKTLIDVSEIVSSQSRTLDLWFRERILNLSTLAENPVLIRGSAYYTDKEDVFASYENDAEKNLKGAFAVINYSISNSIKNLNDQIAGFEIL